MDTATRTLAHRMALIGCMALAALAFRTLEPAVASHTIRITRATITEERVVDWILHCYRQAGLENMPALDVHLHRDHAACNGGIGLYYAGRIDLCTKASSEPYQRKFALHEMAHAWIDSNVEDDVLRDFMERQSLTAWNDRRIPWKERGTEQAASSAGGSGRARSRHGSQGPSTRARSRTCASC
jgi:hypothetical protein